MIVFNKIIIRAVYILMTVFMLCCCRRRCLTRISHPLLFCFLVILLFILMLLFLVIASVSSIYSGHFYSASSSPLALRSAPDTARILCQSFTPKRHRQLWVKDLPKVLAWRLERDSNPRPFGRKASSPPMRHHVSCPVFFLFQIISSLLTTPSSTTLQPPLSSLFSSYSSSPILPPLSPSPLHPFSIVFLFAIIFFFFVWSRDSGRCDGCGIFSVEGEMDWVPRESRRGPSMLSQIFDGGSSLYLDRNYRVQPS